ncbi:MULTISPECIES: DMT family transporter [unclassified Sphingobium]|uniref:DMT family transporter n=1 Tax=unclassified Sphingobium TaxID=2611147 RepID=UPI000D16FAF2|nr:MULTISPECIES: DMT family transporter [unclassified Sphingobium]MBG6119601.1 drug/metabolite transporter (DMT)-like permease [Sphingobium sp. JAI105]PSO13312.1 EamA family transporter [Sphingobium sp. AEW4]TWD11546.1 threonine/homoserine efflux transporter RhtA [Sphingobium sp. AEW010]TWD28563.1 threonine/homoserine efflux transporter RhtA [Sphingobium sp. AEW013]TWD30088.1 threonine/homoserine efflux transporter RhtA [Sphingobium sp. AEW001]
MTHAAVLDRKPVPSRWLIGRAELALIGITILWGGTFLIVHGAVTHSGPLYFVGLRFGTAALLTLPLAAPLLRGMTLRELWAGLVIGLGIFAGYTLQTWGLQTISSSSSAFITAAYVPLVPVLQWIILRRRPRLASWIGVVLAFIGLLLVAAPQDGVKMGKGELITLVSTVPIALEIIFISLFAGSVNILRVTVVQLAVTSLLAFACMVPAGEAIPPFSWAVVIAACGLGAMTAIIQLVMNWAQRTVSPTRATLIYAGEPVWAGIIGRIAGDRLPPMALLGGAMIVAAVIVSELRLGKQADGPSPA